MKMPTPQLKFNTDFNNMFNTFVKTNTNARQPVGVNGGKITGFQNNISQRNSDEIFGAIYDPQLFSGKVANNKNKLYPVGKQPQSTNIPVYRNIKINKG